MKKNMYVVYDLIAKSVFTGVMIADSDELIIRDVKTANLGSVIENNLEDFDLIKVGVIDTDTGVIINTEKSLIAHLEGIKTYGKRKE